MSENKPTVSTFIPADYETDRQGAVDAVVSKISGESTRTINGSEGRQQQSITLERGDVASLTDEEAYVEAQRIASLDEGSVDYFSLVQNLKAHVEMVGAELAHKAFDPVTGNPFHTLTGPAREAKERLFANLLAQVRMQVYISKAVERVRAERAALKAADDDIRAVRTSWTGGDPRRERLVNDAIEQIEANDLATRLINMRRAAGR